LHSFVFPVKNIGYSSLLTKIYQGKSAEKIKNLNETKAVKCPVILSYLVVI